MTQFKDTVQKIASSPYKVRALKTAPSLLTKEAGKNRFFDAQDYKEMMKNIIPSVTTTAVTAAGGLGAHALYEQMVGNQDAIKSQNQEKGKLTAQNSFKLDMVEQLAPKHEEVLKAVMKDDVIAKADKKMMRSAYDTMKKFAPNLAADENAAKSFLRQHAIYGEVPSYASLKNLAESEQAIVRAGGVV